MVITILHYKVYILGNFKKRKIAIINNKLLLLLFVSNICERITMIGEHSQTIITIDMLNDCNVLLLSFIFKFNIFVQHA